MKRFIVAIAVVLAIACTDVGTSPTTPVAIAFDTLPAPSIVYGDTLRDINGVAAPLTAHAYNADGNEIPNAPIEYVLADAASATVHPSGYLVATQDTTKKKITIRAQINGIPSAADRSVEIVFSPDTVDRGAGITRSEDTLSYAGTATEALLNTTLPLRVLDRPDPAKPDSVRGVRSYLVRYSVVAPAGADSLLVNDQARPSTIDTTGVDGVASRKIRLRGNLSTGVPDTVIVEATARNRAGVLPGAPIRYVIILRKTG